MKKVLVIGSLNMDLSVRLNTMPLVGETILGKSLNYIAGGKGANQAASIGKLGGSVTMLACVGDDGFGKVEIDTLSSLKVDTSRIKVKKDIPTGTALIYVDDNGNNSIVVIAAANDYCDIDYIRENEDLLKESDYILMQQEIPYESVEYVAKKAKELGKTVILNPAPARQLSDELLSNIDYLTPNETELMKITSLSCNDDKEIEKACKYLLEKGVKNVIVTLGENGSMLVNKDLVEKISAFKVKSIDTTAAGDCFNGAFVTALSKGDSLKEAITFASKAAAISVTRKGAISSLPSLKEILDLE